MRRAVRVRIVQRIRAALVGTDSRSELARNALLTLMVKVAGLGATFAAEWVLVRLLGVEAYGHYSYALSWVASLGVLAALGTDTAVVRFVATYKGEEDWAALKGVLRWAHLIALGASVGFVLVGVAVLLWLEGEMDASLLGTFYVALAVIPLSAQLQVAAAGLRALHNRASSRIPEMLLRPLTLSTVLVGSYFALGRKLTGAEAALAQAITLGSVVLVALALRHRHVPEALRRTSSLWRRSEWLAVSLPLVLVASTQMLMSRVDIMILGALVNSTEAGVYRVAVQFANLTGFALAALVSVASPIFATIHARGDLRELQRVVSLAVLIASLLTLPIAAILFFGGRVLLSVFAPEFVRGYLPMLLLVAGQLINVFSGVTGSLLSMNGHQNIVARGLGIASACNVVLNFALVPIWGASGAALATASSVTIWNAILAVYARRTLGLRTTIVDAVLELTRRPSSQL